MDFNLENLFTLSNTTAMFSWIILIIGYKSAWIRKLLIGTVITAFAILYTYLITRAMGESGAGFSSFGSLYGVMGLFTNKVAALAGWIHYLAFDLLTGIWIVTNAQKNDIHFLFVLPCLLFTFMMGPFGLLLYLFVRMIYTRSYLVDYP